MIIPMFVKVDQTSIYPSTADFKTYIFKFNKYEEKSVMRIVDNYGDLGDWSVAYGKDMFFDIDMNEVKL